MIKKEFFDVINYAICRAVNEHLGDQAAGLFRRVGEFHLEEALKRGLLSFQPEDTPLERLFKVARYLEACGYMEKIVVNKLSDTEAIVEMHGITVAESSAQLLQEGRKPSHYMTNMMFAALKLLAIRADLQDMEYDAKAARFKEYWKILSPGP
jgi:hypothetical protein